MNEIFFIPSKNKITIKDLNNGYLRVGVNNKKYFPNEDCDIIVVIENIEYTCPFRIRNQGGQDRSYTLTLGKELIKNYNITTSTIFECQKIGDKKYSLTK